MPAEVPCTRNPPRLAAIGCHHDSDCASPPRHRSRRPGWRALSQSQPQTRRRSATRSPHLQIRASQQRAGRRCPPGSCQCDVDPRPGLDDEHGFLDHDQVVVLLLIGWSFDQWGRLLLEHTTAVRLLDRLIHHANGVVTDGDSYRMRQARAKGLRAPAAATMAARRPSIRPRCCVLRRPSSTGMSSVLAGPGEACGPSGVQHGDVRMRVMTCECCRKLGAVFGRICLICVLTTSVPHAATAHNRQGAAAPHAQIRPSMRNQPPPATAIAEFVELPHPPDREVVQSPPGAEAEQLPPPPVPIVPQPVRAARPPLQRMPQRARFFGPPLPAGTPLAVPQPVRPRPQLPPLPRSRTAGSVPVT